MSFIRKTDTEKSLYFPWPEIYVQSEAYIFNYSLALDVAPKPQWDEKKDMKTKIEGEWELEGDMCCVFYCASYGCKVLWLQMHKCVTQRLCSLFFSYPASERKNGYVAKDLRWWIHVHVSSHPWVCFIGFKVLNHETKQLLQSTEIWGLKRLFLHFLLHCWKSELCRPLSKTRIL